MMRQRQHKKKESGAKGQRRGKKLSEDLHKSSQVMTKSLRVPRSDEVGDIRVVSSFVPATDNTDTTSKLGELS